MNTRFLLGLAITVGFFGITLFLIATMFLAPIDFPPGIKEILLILIGHLAAKFGTVVDFYYGTSSSSERKTELLADEYAHGQGQGRILRSSLQMAREARLAAMGNQKVK